MAHPQKPLNRYLTLWLWFASACFHAFAGDNPDKSALLEFRSSVSDPSGVLVSWNRSNSDHCSWVGITCGSDSRVVALNITGGGNSGSSTCTRYDRFPLYGFGIRRDCTGRNHNGKLLGELSSAISKLSELRVLSLPFNDLGGQIPVEIWGMLKLEVIDLEGNSINGSLQLQSHFIDVRNIRVFNLGFNQISGEIPHFLSNLKNLQVLNLAGNHMNGSIPGFIRKFGDLTGLYLSFNRFSGNIPIEIGDNCRNLEHLELSGNFLLGGIPKSLGNCTRLRTLILYSNMLEGEIPLNFDKIKDLKKLSLSGNNLTGPIPTNLGKLKSLEIIDLSSNSLSGEIPKDLVNLKNLTVLLLNDNTLSGLIPPGLGNATTIVKFNVSFNNLSGPLPLNGNLTKCGSVTGNNPYLQSCEMFSLAAADQVAGVGYGNDSKSTIPVPKNGTRNFSPIEIASITSASAIFSVLIALVVLFFWTKRRPKWAAVGSVRKDVTVFTNIGVPLTFENVVTSTGNFNANNCIGNGGFGATYKAEISPGFFVAIKRLAVGRFHGVQQFDAEIRTLGRLRHPNLVTLIGYHASDSEMFLVYNYLPGGNLEKFIQDRPRATADWRHLHKIALDVARALAYLHDQCVPRVLHRDVKPSNILLDEGLNAYLSDFGLARLLGTSETHATTGVAGTFGYVAPEYAMTCRVSDKADVYSYGVVLLELVSDKKVLDPSFARYGNGFNIVAWACMLLRQGRAKEVFAAGLWDAGPHDDLVEALHLAVVCTVDSLSTRPTMKQVVRRLKQLQPASC